MNPRPSSLLVALAISISAAPASLAGVEDLWITEVVPSSGAVEVTNVGADEVVLPNEFAFCHRFQYSDRISGATSFAAGESKVFNLSFSNADDSDLWLYRTTSGFSSATNIISGIKWGPAPDVGRTGIASADGKWSGVGSFVPTPAAGMALQLVGADPFAAANWVEGVPDLGNYPIPEAPLSASLVATGDDTFELSWTGGAPPYLVRSSADLEVWKTEVLTDGTTFSFDRSDFGDRAFLQVEPIDPAETSALFRVTFTSIWSPDVFETVPGGDHFSGLIGMTHNDQVSLWRPGELASRGIESMAETGSKSALSAEINSAINGSGDGGGLLSGGGLGGNGSQTALDFSATVSHPLVSLVSMIAPSPDWFVGVHDLPLIGSDGEWVDSLTIQLLAYDSGSDDGTAFTSANAESDPHVPIVQISGTPPFAVKPGAGEAPRALATFLIERLP
ncbi:MAG: spondin domain-containing protein [Verrucomicrobiales bacterium]